MQEQHDINIKSMHSYLKKKCQPILGLDKETQECLDIVNANSLHFFEMTFNADLKRLKLI